MRYFLLPFLTLFYAFTLINSEEKAGYQEICEAVKFPGGDTAFGKFVYSNLDSKILKKYPDLNGTIYISFIVDTAGTIISTEIKANKLDIPDDSDLVKELRKVILTSPKWEFYDLVDDDPNEFDIDEPSQNCKKIKVRLIYPFKFPIPDFYLEHKK